MKKLCSRGPNLHAPLRKCFEVQLSSFSGNMTEWLSLALFGPLPLQWNRLFSMHGNRCCNFNRSSGNAMGQRDIKAS